MGNSCICYSKDEDLTDHSRNNKQKKDILGPQTLLTMGSLAHLQADCLLLFIDDTFSLKENPFLSKVSAHTCEKAQQYLDVHLQRNAMGVGDHVILPIEMQEVKCKNLALVCVEIWPGGSGQLMAPLEEDLEEAITKISEQNLKKLIISELNPKFGIPNQITQKILARVILKKQAQFSHVTVLCNSQQQMESLQQITKKLQSRATDSPSANSYDKVDSDYF